MYACISVAGPTFAALTMRDPTPVPVPNPAISRLEAVEENVRDIYSQLRELVERRARDLDNNVLRAELDMFSGLQTRLIYRVEQLEAGFAILNQSVEIVRGFKITELADRQEELEQRVDEQANAVELMEGQLVGVKQLKAVEKKLDQLTQNMVGLNTSQVQLLQAELAKSGEQQQYERGQWQQYCAAMYQAYDFFFHCFVC